MATYKERKESFYAGHSGGSSSEILLISAVTPTAIWCAQALEVSFNKPLGHFEKYALNLVVVVMPMYLSFVAPHFSAILIVSYFLFASISLWMSGAKIRDTKSALADVETALNSGRNPFLTAYRGTMMLATCIAILAVDFDSFPRRLAKTETYGVSLMDAGVGSVLLTQAMVSPLARNPSCSTGKRLFSAILSSIPLLLIGGVRIIGTRAADYHEHASEYGVHWNFFFTLAVISIVASALPLSLWSSFVLSSLAAVAYDLLSVRYGLRDYILSHPRTDLLSANREGIFGCIGYMAVFYTGAVIGASVLRAKRSGRAWAAFAVKMLAAAALLWLPLGLLDAAGARVSRRLVNVPYVLWTAAYNLLILAAFLLSELALHFLRGAGGQTAASLRRAAAASSDALSDGFNRNLLALFLAGNLLTGLVNLALPTIDVPPAPAAAIVLAYAAALLAAAMALNHAGLTLKFW
jgi:phosphatidylinositol glycan class W